MQRIAATRLKNELGAALREAMVSPVAIERHGRVVAYLVPPAMVEGRKSARVATTPKAAWDRATEERVVALCAGRDFRPSRWMRAADNTLLAGVAMLLSGEQGFDLQRMQALAEHLHPGMSSLETFSEWLSNSPVAAARFLPLVRARMRSNHEPASTSS